MGPEPMNGILVRRGRFGHRPGGMSGGGGGGEGRDEPVSPRVPGSVVPAGSQRIRRIPPLEALEGVWPCDTWISDSSPPGL